MTEMSILDEQFILQLKKEAEKMMIHFAVASSAVYKSDTNRHRIEKKCKDVLEDTQTGVQHISANMGNGLKGQFGNKVKETLTTHHKKLEQLI
ncbi:hypothetical protein HCB27_14325 [Listeria booriae]|uniref:LXG domain-containing protein n=1 Tax=Listeria booriae TaxID=1552123 RepID=A0A7X1D9K8_9LIST|nr:hypothetical protein [Listeria booriae]MBC2177775.1 hypothetical protein [Listeria booriae]MBC2177804.1 hypothetical protein [Listeria booriae]